MPERIVALFANVPEQRPRIQQMLLDAGLIDELVQPAPTELLYRIELPNEEVARRLDIAARLNGLEPPTIQRYLDPSRKELDAAPLLVLFAGGPGSDSRHPRPGTTYDESVACPQCGAGLRQQSPLIVRATELPKGKTTTACSIAGELLLHESVVPAIAAAVPTLTFREVLGRDGTPVPWRQLVVETSMPPLLATSRGVMRGRTVDERPCVRCARDGWFTPMADPFIPAWSSAMLDRMRDVAWMHELFSTGAWAEPIHGRRMLALRRLVVRPAVYQALRAAKVRGVRATPARIEP